jgi:predicted ATPase
MVLHNLPTQLTSFIGRTHELAEIVGLLDKPDCRLLTLVGPGGMGKTRLALQAAEILRNRGDNFESGSAAFPDGVYFIALQSLASPEFIPSVVVI